MRPRPEVLPTGRFRRARRRRALVGASCGVAVLALTLSACSSSSPSAPAPAQSERVPGGPTGRYVVASGIHKIKHVIVIEQENRSFDSYFGTYPGADGIPRQNGTPTVCVPNPTGGCTAPYHDTADVNGGGPHNVRNAAADVNNGAMDGFITSAANAKKGCLNPTDPACTNSSTPDVMGYHTAAEIPNYWTYAQDFALDDHMFEPVHSWSLPDHLYLVSGWSAICSNPSPSSCKNEIQGPYTPAQMQRYVDQALQTGTADVTDAWTDLTWLLYNHHVPWAYYVQTGDQPDCENDGAETCAPVKQNYLTPGIWNPLPIFEDVQKDHQLRNIEPLDNYFAAAKKGTLPAVSWVDTVPGGQRAPAGERPPGAGLRDCRHQRRHEEPRLGLDGHLLAVGRLGWFLRSRRAADGRQQRLRTTRAGARDLALRQAGLHRSPDVEQRRVSQVHRRRLPRRLAPQPED